MRNEETLISTDDLANDFARNKYAVWRSCVKEPDLSLLYRYVCIRADSGTMRLDGTAPGALSSGGDVFTDGLLVDLLPRAEQVARLALFPTYSYFRVYHRGDELPKHTDRPACEISVSVCLGYEAKRPWPIFVKAPHGVSRIELRPGDALFYRGIDCPHWQKSLVGDRHAQVFLHYVDQKGSLAEWEYDKRPAIPFRRPTRPV